MIDSEEADAQALPFSDGTFDVVLSTFGSCSRLIRRGPRPSWSGCAGPGAASV
jgi:hypothetical protein